MLVIRIFIFISILRYLYLLRKYIIILLISCCQMNVIVFIMAVKHLKLALFNHSEMNIYFLAIRFLVLHFVHDSPIPVGSFLVDLYKQFRAVVVTVPCNDILLRWSSWTVLVQDSKIKSDTSFGVAVQLHPE